MTTNFDSTIPAAKRPQPHHLTTGFQRLLQSGALEEETVVLNGRSVTSYAHTAALGVRRVTETRATARAKRRLYRSFLSWTSHSDLCGSVAERVVHASLLAVAGRGIWLPHDIVPGNVTTFLDREVPIGPLDDAGFWLSDRGNPTAGLIPFCVEVKNVRSWIYPWDHEIWDLLAKMSHFPDAVPVFVSRRIHPVTFHMFRDLGIIGHQTGVQWFHSPGTSRASIDPDLFQEVVDTFRFSDASLIDDPEVPDERLVRLFNETAYKNLDGETLAQRSLRLWQRAAPIAADAANLRLEDLTVQARSELWSRFCTGVAEEGLYDRDQWAPGDVQ